jgi:replicative DNA helicase
MKAQAAVQPQNLEAEKTVLCAILIENDSINEVASILKPADFYLPSHARMFHAMTSLADNKSPIDVIVLADFLKSQGHLEAVGGTASLVELADFTPTAANVAYHAKIVAKESRRRKLLAATTESEDEIINGADPRGAGDRLISAIGDIIVDGAEDKTLVDSIDEVILSIDLTDECDREPELTTGIRAIDANLGNLVRNSLYIIGARTGGGKTSLATNIAAHVAESGAGGVLFFSCEMPTNEILIRIVSACIHIENGKIQQNKLSDFEKQRVKGALREIKNWNLMIDDSTTDWRKIAAKMRARKKADGSLSLIVVDYAQIVTGVRAERRYLELGVISRDSAALAKELDVVVLLLSQLTLPPKDRKEKRPQLGDLRESESLAHSAKTILFPYHDENANRRDWEIIVPKNRNGMTGKINIKFIEEYVKFCDEAG